MLEKSFDMRRLAGCLLSVVLLVLPDQLSKYLASLKLENGPAVVIPSVFEFQYIENSGAAFGMLSGKQMLFIVIAFVFLAAALWFAVHVKREKHYLPLRVCAVVMAAGAAGNLIDRIAFGYVRDFLYFMLIDFPVFNIADIYVTVSAACIMILLLTRYREEEW